MNVFYVVQKIYLKVVELVLIVGKQKAKYKHG
jgi:hypothetical protein